MMKKVARKRECGLAGAEGGWLLVFRILFSFGSGCVPNRLIAKLDSKDNLNKNKKVIDMVVAVASLQLSEP
jgi:hypothetical protein